MFDEINAIIDIYYESSNKITVLKYLFFGFSIYCTGILFKYTTVSFNLDVGCIANMTDLGKYDFEYLLLPMTISSYLLVALMVYYVILFIISAAT